MKNIVLTAILALFISFGGFANDFEKDVFKTSKGDLAITFIAHGTLMMEFDGKVIHIDPVAAYADYAKLPKADLILITHQHGDHLNAEALNLIKKSNSEIVLTQVCSEMYKGTAILKNGDKGTFAGFEIEAVPAYNIENKRSDGNPFHPKGEGNGYMIKCADKKVYVAGDTENIPEMANFKNIDIAFLPMNLPYTMTPEMVANAAKLFKPKVLYPYHFGNTDTDELLQLLKDQKATEVRIRKLS